MELCIEFKSKQKCQKEVFGMESTTESTTNQAIFWKRNRETNLRSSQGSFKMLSRAGCMVVVAGKKMCVPARSAL